MLSVLATPAGGCTGDVPVPVDAGPSVAAPMSSPVTTGTVSPREALLDTSPSSVVATSADSPPEPAAASSVMTVTTVSVPGPSSTDAPSSVVTTTTLPPAEPSKERTLLAGGDVLDGVLQSRDGRAVLVEQVRLERSAGRAG